MIYYLTLLMVKGFKTSNFGKYAMHIQVSMSTDLVNQKIKLRL